MNITSKLLFITYVSFPTLTFASALSSLDNAITVLKTEQTEQAIVLFEKQKHDPEAMIYLRLAKTDNKVLAKQAKKRRRGSG